MYSKKLLKYKISGRKNLIEGLYRAGIAFSLILFLILYSCTTTYVKTVEPDEFLNKMEYGKYEIIDITFKDGKGKSFADIDTKFLHDIDGKRDVIIYDKGSDTVRTGSNTYKIIKYTEYIELKDVSKIKLEFTRKNRIKCDFHLVQ
jgi:hypothetical protein